MMHSLTRDQKQKQECKIPVRQIQLNLCPQLRENNNRTDSKFNIIPSVSYAQKYQSTNQNDAID